MNRVHLRAVPIRMAAGYTSWPALRAAGTADASLAAALAEREAQLRPDDPINIQYTSGEACWLC